MCVASRYNAIYGPGAITKNGTGTVYSLKYVGMYTTGAASINVSAGTVSGTYGICHVGEGTVTITGGNIIGENNYAIGNWSTGTVIIGTSGDAINGAVPVIKSAMSGYYAPNGADKLKFYDGIIAGVSSAINRQTTAPTIILPNESGIYESTKDIAGVTYKTATPSIKAWNISKTASDNVWAYLTTDSNDSTKYILTIRGIGAMKDFTVVNEQGWDTYKSTISELVIEEGVTNISRWALRSLSGISELNIPSSVTSIGYEAVRGCTGLTTVTIPATVTTLNADPFVECALLTDINVEATNPNYCSVDGVLFNKSVTTLIEYPMNKAATSYTIPSTVTTLGYGSFYKQKNLTTLIIPSSVTNISNYAFTYAYDINNIYIRSLSLTLGTTHAFTYMNEGSTIYTVSKSVADKFVADTHYTAANTNVYYPPIITTQPTNKTVAAGNETTFSVIATTGIPTAITYQWQYRTNSSGTWSDATSAQGIGFDTNTFTIVAPTTSINVYQYRCVLSNTAYSSSSVITQSEVGMISDIATLAVTDGNYYDGTNYYTTLQEAFSNAPTSGEINVLKNVIDSSNAELVVGKDIKLNLNGYRIERGEGITDNKGTLTIGTSGEMISTGSRTFVNEGTLTITGGTISAVDDTICNEGTLTLKGGRIEGDTPLESTGNGHVLIDGATVIGTDEFEIYDNSIIELRSGTIESDGWTTIYINNDATLTVNGGSILNTREDGIAIDGNYSASIIINDGTITASSTILITEESSIDISGGDINGRILLGTENTTGTISGGDIEHDGTSATIYNQGSIELTGGIIKGAIPIMNCISGDVLIDGATLIGTKYIETYDNSTMEIRSGNITSSGEHTISLQEDSILTINGGNISNIGTRYYAIEHESTQDLTINDGNILGKISSKSTGDVIVTGGYINGEDAIDLSSGDAIISGGTIEGTDRAIRVRTGTTLTVNGGTISGIEEGNEAAIVADGISTVTVTDGNINSTSGMGIVTEGNAIVRMSGGTIDAARGIYANDASNVEISNGTINSIERSVSIRNTSNALITNGTFNGMVYNAGTGTLRITNGTIEATNPEYPQGVYSSQSEGTVIIGDSGDETVSTTAPSIKGVEYGANVNGIFIFYDGVLKGKTGCIDDSIDETMPGYDLYTTKEMIEGEEYFVGILVEYVIPSSPIITATKESGTTISSGTWSNENLNLVFSGSTTSGVGTIGYKYSTDNTNWIVGSIYAVNEETSKTIYVKAYIEENENIESEVSIFNIRVDKIVPELNVTAVHASDQALLNITSSDSGDVQSKISKIYKNSEVIYDNTISEDVSITTATYLDDAGTYVIKAVDNAGNETSITKTTHTIKYNGNGSTEGSVGTQVKVDDVDITIKKNTYKKSNLAFIEWNTAANGAGTTYVPNVAYEGNANLNLYAIWSVGNYSVDGVYYNTLAAAYTAIAQNGGAGTIKLETASYNDTSSLVVASGKNITIDLNGHTLTLDHAIANNGTLTIIDSAPGAEGRMLSRTSVFTPNTDTYSNGIISGDANLLTEADHKLFVSMVGEYKEVRIVKDAWDASLGDGDNVWAFVRDAEVADKYIMTVRTNGNGEMKNFADYPYVDWKDYRGTSISELVLEEGLKTVGDRAFYDFTGITEIDLPETLTYIGTYSLIYLFGVTESIEIPGNITRMGNNPFLYTPVKSYVVDSENENFKVINNALIYNDTKVVSYPMGNNAISHEVPSGVTSIGSYAYAYSKFKTVDIPNTVTNLAACSFEGSDLTTVTLPRGVESIGGQAFNVASQLKTVYVENPTLVTVNAKAFTGLESNSAIYTLNKTVADKLESNGETIYYTSGVTQVCYPPVIATSPEDITVMEGEEVSFTSTATVGNPSTINYMWQVSSDGITWTDIPGATNNTYVFNAQETDNGKQYRCRLLNEAYPNEVMSGDIMLKDMYSTAAILTVEPANYSITHDGVTTNYTTIQSALVAAQSGDTIELMKNNVIDTSVADLKATKRVILDTNENTMIMRGDNFYMDTGSILEIVGSGEIIGDAGSGVYVETLFKNKAGTLIISGDVTLTQVEYTDNNNSVIYNTTSTAMTIINGGTIRTEKREGTAEYISSVLRINAGKLVINDGTIVAPEGDYAVAVTRSSIFTVESGDIYGCAHIDGGKIYFKGGQITVDQDKSAIFAENVSTVSVTGGRLVCNGDKQGILYTGSAQLTIGTQGAGVNKNSPEIIGNYGVSSTKAYSFYNGVLKGRTAARTGGYSPIIPTGYAEYNSTEEIDGVMYYTSTVMKNSTLTAPGETVAFIERDKTVSYEYIGDGNVSAQVGNPSLATVNVDQANKTLTIRGLSYGNTTITLTASEGAEYTAKSAVFNLKVREDNYKDNLGNYYDTLERAFNNVANGGTIMLLTDLNDSSNAILPAGKSVTLDLQNFTMIKSVKDIKNRGNLTISGDGTITTLQTNENTLSVLIENYNRLTVNNGTLISSGYNNSTWYTIDSHNASSVVNINGGMIKTIMGTGRTTVKNGRAIIMYAGTLNVNGGTLTNEANNEETSGDGIIVGRIRPEHTPGNVVININGGNILSDMPGNAAVYSFVDTGMEAYTTTINITGGLLKTSGDGVRLDANTKGTTTITGGEIISGMNAIDNMGAATNVVIGTNDDTINKISPVIQGLEYGISSVTNFEFNNGIIKGKVAAINGGSAVIRSGCEAYNRTETINGEEYYTTTVMRTPTFVAPNDMLVLVGNEETVEYTYVGDGNVTAQAEDSNIASVSVDQVNKTITINSLAYGDTTVTLTASEGAEYAPRTATFNIQSRENNYMDDAGNQYDTLERAFNNVANGATITVMKNVIDESNAVNYSGISVTLVVPEGKTLTKTTNTIKNNGTLTIEGAGTITTSEAINLITNAGHLELNHTGIISNMSSENYTVTGNGSITMNGTGNIYSNFVAIGTWSDGRTITLNNGTISGTYGIRYAGTEEIIINENVTVIGRDGYGVSNASLGTLRINGGYIYGKFAAVYDQGRNGGRIIVGNDDGTIQTTSPILLGESRVFYDDANGTGNFEWYDGIIKVKTSGRYSGDKTTTTFTIPEEHAMFENSETISGDQYKTGILTKAWDISAGDGDNVWAYLLENGTTPETYTLVIRTTGNGYMKDFANYGDAEWYSIRNKVTELVLEEGLKNVGERAFYELGISDLTFPNTLKDIGKYAFNYCTELSGILTIPASVTYIGLNPFLNCYYSEYVVESGNTHITIDDGALIFNNTVVSYPAGRLAISHSVSEGITAIESYAYAHAKITTINMPSTLTSIYYCAFQKAELTTVTVPINVTTIGVGAFAMDDTLESVYITGRALDSIGEAAFVNMTEDSIIYLPTSEMLNMFQNWTGGTDVWDAGTGCYNSAMTTIYYPATITTQPMSRTVTAGENVTFSIETSEAKPNEKTYVWQVQNSGEATWMDITDATSSSYTLETNMTKNGNKYRCQVTTKSGDIVAYPNSAITRDLLDMTSEAATLTVLPANYKVNRTSVNYNRLKDALDNVIYGDTITVLQNVTDNSLAINYEGVTTTLVIPEGITLTKTTNAITNEGELSINGGGTIYADSDFGVPVYNDNIMSISNVTVAKRASTGNTIYNGGTLTTNNTVISKDNTGWTIENNGILNLNGGSVTSENSSTIYNTSGEITIEGTEITTQIGHAVCNPSITGSITLNNGTKIENIVSGNCIENQGILNINTGAEVTNKGTGFGIYNYGAGNITITGGKVTSKNTNGIENSSVNGNITLNSGAEVLTEVYGHAIENQGTLSINSGAEVTNQGTGFGIYNYGTGNITITGGKVTSKNTNGIENSSVNGNITLNSGAEVLTEVYGHTINNHGTVTVNEGATITNTGANCGIYNNDGATAIIRGGSISTSAGNAIENKNATLTIDNGTSITSNNGNAVRNTSTGTVTISGDSTLTSNGANEAVVNIGTGIAKIISGTIKAENAVGIYNLGTIELGTVGNGVSVLAPEIQGETDGINNGGTIKFYDGVIRGRTNAITGRDTAPDLITEADMNVFYSETEINDKTYKTGILARGWNISKTAEVDNVWAYLIDDPANIDMYILIIRGSGDGRNFNVSEDLDIPWSLEGKNDSISEVKIEEGVTGVGTFTCYEISNATKLSLPSTLRTIGLEAFREMDSLKTAITIPSAVTDISINPFVFTPISAINVEAGNTGYKSIDGILYTISEKTIIAYPSGKDLVDLFEIPDTVETIRTHALIRAKIRNLIIPDSVTFIGGYGVSYLSEIENIYIESNNMDIDTHAFAMAKYGSKVYTANETVANKFINGTNYDMNRTTVYYPPEFTAHPNSQTIVAGEQVQFSIDTSISVPDEKTYAWQVQNSGESTWTNITGATNTIYTFTTSMVDNGKSYRCLVTTKSGDTVAYPNEVITRDMLEMTSEAAILTVTPANYSDGTTRYTTLKQAFDLAPTGSTITVLQNVADASEATNANTFTLNLNGYNITKAGFDITNNATLTILGSGEITRENGTAVVNNGTLIVGNNENTVNNSELIISGSTYAIDSIGTVEFYDGTLKGKTNAYNGEISTIADGYGIQIGRDGEYKTATLKKLLTSITVSPISYVYDGTAKEPTATVYDGVTVLTENVDYTISYSNNIEIGGTATVTAHGINDYTGEISATFRITHNPVIKARENSEYVLGSLTYLADQIKTINIVESYVPGEEVTGAIDSWDASFYADEGTVRVWIKNKTTVAGKDYYDMYIGGHGSIYAPADATNMFAGYANVTAINGLDTLNRSLITNMTGMFKELASIERLDLTNFDTRNVTTTANMFEAMLSLKTLLLGDNFTKLDGANMFNRDTELTAVILTKDADTSSDVTSVVGSTLAEMGVSNNTIIYVPDEVSQSAYIAKWGTTNTSMTADRVKPMIALLGVNPVVIGMNVSYVDAGATVAGFESANKDMYEAYGYILTGDASDIDMAVEDDYVYTYTLRNTSGEVVMTISRDVYVRQVPTKPVITGRQGTTAITSGMWASGDIDFGFNGSTFRGEIEYQYSFDEENWITSDRYTYASGETLGTKLYVRTRETINRVLVSETAEFNIKVDMTRPRILSHTDNNYSGRFQVVNLSAEDPYVVLNGASGIKDYKMTYESGETLYDWQVASSFIIPANGTYYVYARDVAGNVSDRYEVITSLRKTVEVTLPGGAVEYHLSMDETIINLTNSHTNICEIKLLEDDRFETMLNIASTQDFKLDLNGATLYADGNVGFNIFGKLQVVNGSISGDGNIEMFKNNTTGTLTIGTKDNTVDNEDVVINVIGNGIVSTGTYNFYDGTIISRDTPTSGNVSDTEEGYFLRTVNHGTYKEAFAESTETFITDWDISKIAGVDNVHAGLKYIAGDGTLQGSTYRLIVHGTGNTKDYLPSGDTSTAPWAVGGFSDKIMRLEVDETVTGLGDFLYYGLGEITHQIVISKNITEISGSTFGLVPTTGFEVSAENEAFEAVDGVLYNRATHTLVSYPYGKMDLTDYTIEENTVSIDKYAFYGNTKLNQIFMVDSITTISENAFVNMKNGSKIYLVDRIDADMFNNGNYTSERTSLYYPYEITDMNEPATVEYDTRMTIAPTVINGNTTTDVNYQWYKDGVAIVGATSSTYVKNNVRFNDSGDYMLVIKNAIYNDNGDYYYTVASEEVNIKVVDTQVPKSVTYGVTYSGDGALITINAADDQSGVKRILVNNVDLPGVTLNETNGTAAGSIYVDEKCEMVITAIDGFDNRTTITINAYDVTYNVNSETEVGGTVIRQTKITNAPLTLRMNNFTKKGYTFVEWNTTSEGNGISYVEGSTYEANADVELFAKWQVNKYRITFYNNNGLSGDMLISTGEYEYGTMVTVPGIQDRVGELLESGDYRIYDQYGWSGDNTNGDNVDIVLPVAGGKVQVTTDMNVRYDATYTYEDRSVSKANVRLNGEMTVHGEDIGIYNMGGLVIIGSGDTIGTAPVISGDNYAIKNENGLILFKMGLIQGPVYGLIK